MAVCGQRYFYCRRRRTLIGKNYKTIAKYKQNHIIAIKPIFSRFERGSSKVRYLYHGGTPMGRMARFLLPSFKFFFVFFQNFYFFLFLISSYYSFLITISLSHVSFSSCVIFFIFTHTPYFFNYFIK